MIRSNEKQRFRFIALVVTYNSSRTIGPCLERLSQIARNWAHDSDRFVIFVVDNASSDNTLDIVSQFKGVRIIANKTNIGFGAANNVVLEKVTADVFLLINCDAYISESAFFVAYDCLQRSSSVGIIGFPLVYPNGAPQPAAYAFTTVTKKLLQTFGVRDVISQIAKFDIAARVLMKFEGGSSFVKAMSGRSVSEGVIDAKGAKLSEVDWVCGAAMLVRGSCVDRGLRFDERFFLYYEDEDICRQARAGGVGVAQINSLPVVHDCGWDSSRGKPAIGVERLKSANRFIDKYYSNSRVSKLALKTLLRVAPYRW